MPISAKLCWLVVSFARVPVVVVVNGFVIRPVRQTEEVAIPLRTRANINHADEERCEGCVDS